MAPATSSNMTITSKIPRITTEVLVDSVALPQYEDEEENHASVAMVTKYIEAKSGADFVIRYSFEEKPQYDVRVDVHLDGKWAASKPALLKAFRTGALQQTIDGVKSNNGGRWVLAKFSFTDLKTVDSTSRPSKGQLVGDLKELGQITINFSYITNLRLSTQILNPHANCKGVGEVLEKALKGRALTHQSTLRDPVPTAQRHIMASDCVDPRRQPFLTVKFKYRSKDALKSLMVLPRSPSPVPLEERDVDTLSPEEMRQLLRRQRERDVAAKALKRGQGVKRERSRERSRTATVDDGDAGDVSFVSAKRRKLPRTLDEDGTETIDLT